MKIFGKIENGKVKLNNSKDYDDYINTLKEGDIIELDIKKPINTRTSRQNAAIHLYCTQLSKAFNEDGIDMRAVIRPEIDIFWTPYNVKEFLWKSTQKLLFGKESTKQLNKIGEIEQIYDIINKTIGERTGIHIPFPSIENLRDYE